VEHQEAVLLLVAAVQATNAGDRIPPALRAAALRHAPEWVEHPVCLLRVCRANRRDVPARLRADQDSAISMGRKKAR
jgi:hypothetical protein